MVSAPGSKSGTRPNKKSTAIETPAARASTVAATLAGLSTRNSRTTTETDQNGLAPAPAPSVFDNISRTPIRAPIPKRPVATDWFTPAPTPERAESAHNKPAEYTRQDVGDLIEEEKAKALHETCRLAEETTSSPGRDHTRRSSTAPDNDGPTDYLARIEGYLNSMKTIKTKQDSYLQSRGISKRTLAIHPRHPDRTQQSDTDCQGTPAVPPSPNLCQAKDLSDVSSHIVPSTEATTPFEVTSTPTTPQDIQPFQLATMANAIEDGEVLATNRRRGLKRRNEREPSPRSTKRRMNSMPRYDARSIAGAGQTWMGRPVGSEHSRNLGGYRYDSRPVRTMYDSYRPKYSRAVLRDDIRMLVDQDGWE